MARNILTALDVGTSTIQTVVAEHKKGEDKLRILGIGSVPAAGIRRGMVVDFEEAMPALRRSVHEAQKSAGVPIRSVWLAVGGAYTAVSSSRGVVAVSRADQEISQEDVRRAIVAAGTFVAKSPNREVLHMIPRDFKVDNEAGIKDPVGMRGVRLEVDTLIIECSSSFLKNLFKCVEGAGLKVEDYVFSPLAAAEAVLSKRQKELGTMLLDMGGSTANFIVFEEGVPIHAGVILVGGNHITNDIAIGMRTQVDVAERVKLAYGSCLSAELSKRDNIRLAEFIEGEESSYSRRELAEIVEARLQDLYELVQKELRKIDKNQLLPGGVVLIGGSSLLPGIISMAKQEIKLPVDLGQPLGFYEALDEKVAPAFAAVFGVAKWADLQKQTKNMDWGGRVMRLGEMPWLRWLKSLLP